MANKRTLHLASTQANKLMAELPERQEEIKTQVRLYLETKYDNLKNVLITNMNSTGCKVLND